MKGVEAVEEGVDVVRLRSEILGSESPNTSTLTLSTLPRPNVPDTTQLAGSTVTVLPLVVGAVIAGGWAIPLAASSRKPARKNSIRVFMVLI